MLIVPGAKTKKITERTIAGLFDSLASCLSRRRAIARFLICVRSTEILEQERPDIIESSDPYQIAWKAIAHRQDVSGFRWSAF